MAQQEDPPGHSRRATNLTAAERFSQRKKITQNWPQKIGINQCHGWRGHSFIPQKQLEYFSVLHLARVRNSRPGSPVWNDGKSLSAVINGSVALRLLRLSHERTVITTWKCGETLAVSHGFRSFIVHLQHNPYFLTADSITWLLDVCPFVPLRGVSGLKMRVQEVLWKSLKPKKVLENHLGQVINSHQHQTPPPGISCQLRLLKGPRASCDLTPKCLSHHETLQSTMGIVEEISTKWPGAVFGHIPTSGKLAEIRCNCMPLISQYKCYTNGALSGMCRPEEHSSSHPQQCKTTNLKKMHGLPWIHKSIGFRRWDVHFAQTWFLWCMHLIWASRPCKKLCHTIIRSIESYWRPAGRKNLRAACLVLKLKVRGEPGFCRTSTTRKKVFFRILPSIKELMATANLGSFFFKMIQLDSTRKRKTKQLSSKRDCWIHTFFTQNDGTHPQLHQNDDT